MFHATTPLPVYITSLMTGGVKPTPVYAVNATSEWVTPAQFYAYTGGSELEPPASAPSTYATIDSVDFAIAGKADKTYVDTEDAKKLSLTGGTLTGNLTATGLKLSSTGRLIYEGELTEIRAGGNGVTKVWTLPTTSGNVSFLHNGTDNIGSSVTITSPTGASMNFGLNSPAGYNTAMAIGSSSASTYINIGRYTNSGGNENGRISFGASAAIVTGAGNTVLRTWTIPGTTTDVQFLHTGESQTKTGSLTLGSVKLSASPSVITSIETTMPATATNSQFLTAKAVQDAIGSGGGGSYLPLAGGTMISGAIINFPFNASSHYLFKYASGIGLTNGGIWDTGSTDGFVYCSGFQTTGAGFNTKRVEMAANTTTTGPVMRGYSSGSDKRFELDPLATGGKLTIMDGTGATGIRLEGSNVVANTCYVGTSYGLGNVTISSEAPTAGTTWKIPNSAGTSFYFASTAALTNLENNAYTYFTHSLNIYTNNILKETITIKGMKNAQNRMLCLEGFRIYYAADTYNTGVLHIELPGYEIALNSGAPCTTANGLDVYTHMITGTGTSKMLLANPYLNVGIPVGVEFNSTAHLMVMSQTMLIRYI